MYDIPILFIFFNREESALKVFESIRQCKPKHLYLSSDGPRDRKANEKEVVQNLRDKITAMIDWDCELHTMFQEKNVGCGPYMYKSIDWLFQNEECGIILEDDCIPNASFFTFMEYALKRFKDDSRIGMIAGTNPIAGYQSPYSYLYSRFNICWGWASWRTDWQTMDYKMSWRHTPLEESIIKNRGYACKDTHRWRWQIEYIENDYVSAWDWQWYFSLAAQNKLCVYPQVNLVNNIGNDLNATHNSKAGNISFATKEMKFPITDPPYIVPDIEFEKLMYRQGSSLKLRINRYIPHRLKELKNKILGKLK